MAFNIDRGDKEPEKQKEFLQKLIIMPDRYQNNCEGASTIPEDSDERINFFLDIVKYFRCECKFAKQIDSNLESVKRFFVNLKFVFKNLDDEKKQTEGAYIKVEEFLFNKLRDELNKPKRKDNPFETVKTEQIYEVLGLRLNLDKYLNRLGKKLEKFENSMDNLIKKLNKVNLIREKLLDINSKDRVKKLKQLDELVRSEEEKYKEQYVEKIEYLLDNAKMVLEAKEEDKEADKSLINLFKDKTYLLVGYCLVNQFITMFNEEGKPKIRVFSATESFMAEHSALLGNVLGKRNVDIASYINISNQLKSKIEELCKHIEHGDGQNATDFTEKCLEFVKEILEESLGYSSIERKDVIFERPDEWDLIKVVDQVDEEGFRLADDSFMLVDMKQMPNLTLESREWAELYSGTLDRFNEHKFTLTEAHYLFHSVLPLMDKNASKLDHKELSDKLKDLNINQELTNEIKELKTHPQNKTLSSSIIQKLPKIEVDYILRKNVQDCSLATYLLKFTLLNLDRSEITLEEQKMFLTILQSKLKAKHGMESEVETGELSKAKKIENLMNEKATFVKKVFDNFIFFCAEERIHKGIRSKTDLVKKQIKALEHPFKNILEYLGGGENEGKKLEKELAKKVETKKVLDPLYEVLHWKLNSNYFLGEAYKAVNQFDKELKFLNYEEIRSEIEKQILKEIQKLEKVEEEIKEKGIKEKIKEHENYINQEIQKRKVEAAKVDEIEGKIEKLLKEIEQIKERNKELVKLDIIKKKIGQMTKNIKDKSKKSEIEELEKQREEIEKQIQKSEEQMDYESETIYQMKKQMDKRFDNLEEQIEANKKKIKESEEEIEASKHQIKESKKQIEEIETQIEAISTEIEPLVNILREKDQYFSVDENEELKKNWKMYCYIEKYNTQFEQPKVLKLHYYDSLLPDGFHLASLGIIGIDTKNVPGFFSVSEFLEKNAYIYSMHKTTYTEAHHILAKFWKDYGKIVVDENKNSLEHHLSKSKPFVSLENALEKHKKNVKDHEKEIEDHHKKNVNDHVKEIEDHHKKHTIDNKEHEKHTKSKEDKAESSMREEEVDDENTPLLGKEHDKQVSEVEEILGEENAPLLVKEHSDVSTHGKGAIAKETIKKMKIFDKKADDTHIKNVEVHKYISYHSSFTIFRPKKSTNNIRAGHITNVKSLSEAYGEFASDFSHVHLKESLKKAEVAIKMLDGIINFYDKNENVLNEDFNGAFLDKTKKEFDNLLTKKLDNLAINWEAILDENLKEVEQKHTLEGSTHASKDKEVGESSDHATTHLQPKPSLDKEGLKQIFTGLGGYFVNFCFAQRFLQTFNEQGTVKMSSFIKNEAEQEYGLKLYDMMDREILNTGFYQTIKNEIENFLKSKCNSLGTAEKQMECNAFLKDMLLKWHGYCSMDTDNLKSERFEELELLN
uniref:Uncharacterized protein n=1 Tax=Meloidogyne javanica TaxID=6303 RepID=A0A915M9C5_MELJA